MGGLNGNEPMAVSHKKLTVLSCSCIGDTDLLTTSTYKPRRLPMLLYKSMIGNRIHLATNVFSWLTRNGYDNRHRPSGQ